MDQMKKARLRELAALSYERELTADELDEVYQIQMGYIKEVVQPVTDALVNIWDAIKVYLMQMGLYDAQKYYNNNTLKLQGRPMVRKCGYRGERETLKYKGVPWKWH